MNFTNINDPAGVKALLDQLRVSQAWKEVALPAPQEDSSSRDTAEDPIPSPTTAASVPDSSNFASVASLLSQLQSSSPWPAPPTKRKDIGSFVAPVSQAKEPSPPLTASASSSSRKQDTRSYTFQQALPHIAHLADDPEFVAAIRQLKKDQDDIERQLWEDRQAIQKKYEEKVKVATTKANMIGDGGLSKHEADMMQAAFKKELERFDRERVLLAWDGLVAKQQTALALQGVPTMFMTNDSNDREKQQRVMQVLEGIL